MHPNQIDRLELPPLDLQTPYQRLTCQEAFLRYAGFDPLDGDARHLVGAGRSAGVQVPEGASWDDAFTQILLEKVEPELGKSRPVYLCDYPISQAALAKRSPRDPRVAERFELYAAGLELCNGFSELTDAAEQRARFLEEQRSGDRSAARCFPSTSSCYKRCRGCAKPEGSRWASIAC